MRTIKRARETRRFPGLYTTIRCLLPVCVIFRVILAWKTLGIWGGVLSCFLSLHPQTTKKPPKHWIFQHLRGFFKVELRGIESLKNSSIYQRFRAACDISCDTYMILNCLKCSLIFLFCRAVSRSITFLYTAFITLSEAQPPRWSMY